MKLKVIIRDGIVESVLTDDPKIPVEVQIVDIDDDYEDFEELRKYAEELYDDPAYEEVPVYYEV